MPRRRQNLEYEVAGPLRRAMAPEQTLSDDDFAPLHALLGELIELRTMPEPDRRGKRDV
jgi:hypothetical protein